MGTHSSTPQGNSHTGWQQRARQQLSFAVRRWVLRFCSSLGGLINSAIYWLRTQQTFWKSAHFLIPSDHQQGCPCFCHSQSSVEHKESPLSSPHTLFSLLHCLFCIGSTSIPDSPHKNTKLQDLINLQEQLRSLVRKLTCYRDPSAAGL